MENYQLDSVFQIAFNMIRIPYNQLDEILTYERFIEEGASRLGTSRLVKIEKRNEQTL